MDHGIVIQLAHHLRKGANVGAGNDSWFDGLRGSNALESGCDAVLGVGRKPGKQSGRLLSRLRDAELEPIPFCWDDETLVFERTDASPTRAGGIRNRLATRARPAHPDDEVCKAALAAFSEDPASELSSTDLCGRLDVTKNTARVHLEALAEAGILARQRTGRTDRYSPTGAAAAT